MNKISQQCIIDKATDGKTKRKKVSFAYIMLSHSRIFSGSSLPSLVASFPEPQLIMQKLSVQCTMKTFKLQSQSIMQNK